jgi:hypothetical protein
MLSIPEEVAALVPSSQSLRARPITWGLLVAIAAGALVVPAIVRTRTARGDLVRGRAGSTLADTRIRVPRWTDKPTPQQTRFVYAFEAPEALADFRRSERLDDVVGADASNLELARKLAAWARQQFPPTKPDPYPPLSAPIFLNEIRAGRTGGFCAQYVALVVQGLASFGRYARYATVEGHEVMSVYDENRANWQFYDPMNDVWAEDDDDRAISGLSVHRRLTGEEEGAVHWRSGLDHDAAWYAEYENHVRGLYAVWLLNDWTTHPHDFSDIQRSLLFWCPLETGCVVPRGASQSHSDADFHVLALDAAAYRARAAPIRAAGLVVR